MNQPGWDEEINHDDNSEGSLGDHLSQHLIIKAEEMDKDEQPLVTMEEDIIKKDTDGADANDATNGSSSSSDLDEDESRRAGERYFGVNGGLGGGPKCFNCGATGHISKGCPESNDLPCFLCGGKDHQRRECPEEICYNCGKVGHMSKACKLPRKRWASEYDFCNKCGMSGHLQKDCSLIWRRYMFSHQPTKHEINRASTMVSPYCYNCASSFHFGDECPNKSRRPEYSIFHRPVFEFLQATAYGSPENRTKSSPPKSYSYKPSREVTSSSSSSRSKSKSSDNYRYESNKSIDNGRYKEGGPSSSSSSSTYRRSQPQPQPQQQQHYAHRDERKTGSYTREQSSFEPSSSSYDNRHGNASRRNTSNWDNYQERHVSYQQQQPTSDRRRHENADDNRESHNRDRYAKHDRNGNVNYRT